MITDACFIFSAIASHPMGVCVCPCVAFLVWCSSLSLFDIRAVLVKLLFGFNFIIYNHVGNTTSPWVKRVLDNGAPAHFALAFFKTCAMVNVPVHFRLGMLMSLAENSDNDSDSHSGNWNLPPKCPFGVPFGFPFQSSKYPPLPNRK